MHLLGNLNRILFKELRRGWLSAMLIVICVAVLTGALVFLSASGTGFEREISRSVRDMGSNIVILPQSVDQVAYHLNGGMSEETMPDAIVDQLIEYKASLNHLIPMLERPATVASDGKSSAARVIGLAASIPMPGRPKAPMQRAIKAGEVQLGSQIARQLGMDRDTTDEKNQVTVDGTTLVVQRVNKATGNWQDSTVLMDLEQAQQLFALPDRVSRIEAIECTGEQCAITGNQPYEVLRDELAEVTDQAVLLRRSAIAEGRRGVRFLTGNTLRIVNNLLWIMLVCAVCVLAGLNAYWRKPEVGLLTIIGYGPWHVLALIVSRATLLALVGAALGALLGSRFAYQFIPELLTRTGNKFTVDATSALHIVLCAVALSALAACLPGLWAVSQQPADILGENG